MSAPERQPRDGKEAALLQLYRQVPAHRRRAFVDAMARIVDGQSSEDSYIEMLVEMGETPAVARQKVRQILAEADDWRNGLN